MPSLSSICQTFIDEEFKIESSQVDDYSVKNYVNIGGVIIPSGEIYRNRTYTVTFVAPETIGDRIYFAEYAWPLGKHLFYLDTANESVHLSVRLLSDSSVEVETILYKPNVHIFIVELILAKQYERFPHNIPLLNRLVYIFGTIDNIYNGVYDDSLFLYLHEALFDAFNDDFFTRSDRLLPIKTVDAKEDLSSGLHLTSCEFCISVAAYLFRNDSEHTKRIYFESLGEEFKNKTARINLIIELCLQVSFSDFVKSEGFDAHEFIEMNLVSPIYSIDNIEIKDGEELLNWLLDQNQARNKKY